MPPKRSRTTRATRAAEAAAQDTAAQEETAVPETSPKAQVDGANDQDGKVEEESTTVAERMPNGTQVNGKLAAPKSAAQKKREKRKQKRREGSVMSEVSDTESVQPSPLGRSLLTLDNHISYTWS
jgi:hypothetical protein